MLTDIITLTQQAFNIDQARHNLLHQRGESYNIFSVLRIEHKEVVLHSRIIGDLLDPNGWHGQKELYLRLFLEAIGLDHLPGVELVKTKVYIEYKLSNISDDGNNGGSIDILIIFSDKTVILIENKINAADQEKQLIRYRNQYNDGILLYLTKGGTLPSEISTHQRNPYRKVICFESDPKNKLISYKDHIISWIDACYNASVRLPLIRETLFQYKSIINDLTNKINDEVMDKEIASVICRSHESLQGFFTLTRTGMIEEVEKHLIKKFSDELKVKATGIGLIFDDLASKQTFEYGEKFELWFAVPATGYSVSFGFDERAIQGSIGIHHSDKVALQEANELSLRLSNIFGPHTDPLAYPEWLYLLYFRDSKIGDEYLQEWTTGSEIWADVLNGSVVEKIVSYFKTFLSEMKALKVI